VLHVFSFAITAVSGTIGLDREGESFKHLVASAQSLMSPAKNSTAQGQ
jgi:hypothetical protein